MKVKRFGQDRPGPHGRVYYEGPWELDHGNKHIAHGNIMVFHPRQIVPEVARQVDYFVSTMTI